MAFADKLKDLREKEKLTQADLANKLGVTQRTISYYETGKGIPNDPDVLDRLRRLFNVSLDYLLLDDNTPESKLHQLIKKLIKDTSNSHLGWNLFSEANYVIEDNYGHYDEISYASIFSLEKFAQYTNCTLEVRQSYLADYSDGAYLIAKIITKDNNIIYVLFIFYKGQFHPVTDSKAIEQTEDLYWKIADTQNNVNKFIDTYLKDDLELKEEKSAPFSTEIFPDEEIPF